MDLSPMRPSLTELARRCPLMADLAPAASPPSETLPFPSCRENEELASPLQMVNSFSRSESLLSKTRAELSRI